ncbi:MAG TPA: hypothetical protein PK079_00350 [Leptospiraceae bacterium]|nr:hypothetical protein [Leptospiraceae bacterium]HMW05200.1 hypothetical protein [Leptospiraceae bacterium]HMX32545.1 hypothetical protein [Leptospiraceae bacterium]HMY32141.1 hypothetical protein [Leptospiraceae bacterium]HMZ63478.1 hypothetical protein [Leptospiraceae bacterium]
MELTTKFFNFILGLSGQAMEEADRIKRSLEKEYSRILSIGANNNSGPAIALRETTETVIIFFEDLKFKLNL